MQYLITESQLRLMVEAAGGSPEISGPLKKMFAFARNVFHDVYKSYNINLRFLLTWGSAIAGIMMPLDQWIRTKEWDISESQINLILCGVAAMLYYDNKKSIQDVKNKIKEEGLTKYFTSALKKAQDLKSSFEKFVKSVIPTLNQSVELLSYAFMIPIIGDLQSMIQDSGDIVSTAELIGERFLASGVVLISGLGLVSFLKEVLKRISK